MKIFRTPLALVAVLASGLLGPGLASAQTRSVELRLTALESAVATLTQGLAAANNANAGLAGQLQTANASIAALEAALAREVADRRAYADAVGTSTLAAAKTYSDARLAPVADRTAHFTRQGSDVYITGANLHIRNGTGYTGTANGLGNLVLGYNELRTGTGAINERTGSHNLAIGYGANFTSYSSLVGGINNGSKGPMASVIAGTGNVASGNFSVVVGGYNNQAIGNWAFIGGGRDKVVTDQLGSNP